MPRLWHYHKGYSGQDPEGVAGAELNLQFWSMFLLAVGVALLAVFACWLQTKTLGLSYFGPGWFHSKPHQRPLSFDCILLLDFLNWDHHRCPYFRAFIRVEQLDRCHCHGAGLSLCPMSWWFDASEFMVARDEHTAAYCNIAFCILVSGRPRSLCFRSSWRCAQGTYVTFLLNNWESRGVLWWSFRARRSQIISL